MNVSLIFAVLSLLSVHRIVAVVLLVSWFALGIIALRELGAADARVRLGRPPEPKPPLGRYGWKFFAVWLMAMIAPVPMAVAFLTHLPLFAAEARQIESASSFHFRPPAHHVGLLWIKVDRCPHATYFLGTQHGNPFAGHVTLLHRTEVGDCEYARGIPIWPDWRVKPGTGRGRDPAKL